MHLVNINVLVHNIKAKYFGKQYFNLITYDFWFWPVYIQGCVGYALKCTSELNTQTFSNLINYLTIMLLFIQTFKVNQRV